MKCDYCKNKGTNRFLVQSKDMDTGVDAKIANLDQPSLVVSGWFDGFVGIPPVSAPINYCPMCGRALGGVSRKGAKKVLRIKKFLGERCMTQTEAAELCGLKQQAFNRIVNGIEPPYPKRGQRIADALGWAGDWRVLFEEIEVN